MLILTYLHLFILCISKGDKIVEIQKFRENFYSLLNTEYISFNRINYYYTYKPKYIRLHFGTIVHKFIFPLKKHTQKLILRNLNINPWSAKYVHNNRTDLHMLIFISFFLNDQRVSLYNRREQDTHFSF